MSDLTVGFIGLGLIGGSIARAIKYYYPNARILAHTRSSRTMDFAKKEQIIDEGYPAITDAFHDCDYLFLCAPVETNASYLPTIAPILKDGCILTDVGSTKGDIHQKVQEARLTHCFIGGHPMAGSEKTGIENSKRILLENAYYILTPEKDVPTEQVERFRKLVRSLKALPLVLSYEEHDYSTAAVSHLPHIIAPSLVNLVHDSDTEKKTMKTIAAGGFKDITRIASSSPEMWEQLCATNRDNILKVLDAYLGSLSSIRQFLADGDHDAIYRLFEESRDYRNSISDTAKGPLPKSYSIYCDMIDEAGGIAALATILATNGISIKNIGIVHNREFEEAVLHVEFYEEDAMRRAVSLLRRYRYVIYERN